jgi:glycosyltransferase involved in cell wall biosynthesis
LNGYDVVGICAPGQYVIEVEQAGIRVVTVPMTRRITPLRDLLSLFRLVAVLRREQPDIVHSHTPKANLLGQLAAKVAGVPCRVSTVHGLYFTSTTPLPKRLLFQTSETLSAAFAQIVFLINREDVNTAIGLKICRSDQVKLLPGGLGIDLQRFDVGQVDQSLVQKKRSELGLTNDTFVVGYVGRLVREKGVLDLFAAVAQVLPQIPQLRLLVVGSYDDAKPDAVRPEAAQQYGIWNHCIFTGMRKDTEYLYSLMDVFVLPSYREGMPLSIMEAQAMGCPVVTTDARGCRESIVPGQTGLLVPSGDPSALAAALLSLYRDPALRQSFARTGRQLAQERFDQRLAFETFEQAYASLCATGVRPTQK